jgi:predicted DNA-binding transcriptional regulator AlpA
MPLLNTFQASQQTGLARATLAKLRVFGGGPKFLKLGAKVLYEAAELEAWIATRQRMRSTSECLSDDAMITHDGGALARCDRRQGTPRTAFPMSVSGSTSKATGGGDRARLTAPAVSREGDAPPVSEDRK